MRQRRIMSRRVRSTENTGPLQGVERSREASSVGQCERQINTKNSAVQTLFQLCNEIFSRAGIAPSPEDIQRLRTLLDTIKPADVGLSEDTAERDSRYGPFGPKMGRGRHRGRRPAIVARFAVPVTYLHVYECDAFSMGIFVLPTSASIPLHNHPGMTVLSKLLYGSLHLKSCDFINPTDAQQNEGPSQSMLAKSKVNTVLTAPCETFMLSPTMGGTIHSLTAVTSCAVLDVLAPPYSETDGRHCTYYRDYPYSNPSENGNTQTDNDQDYIWLEEVERPDDFFVIGGVYKGPKFEDQ